MIYILYVVCARYMRQTAGKPAWPGGRFKWNNTSSCYAPSSQAIERMAGYYRALSEPMRLCAASMSCAAGPSVWEKWPNACNRAMPTFPSISLAGPARPANKIMPNRRRRLIKGARAGAQSPRQAPCTQAVFQKHGPLCEIGADPAQTFPKVFASVLRCRAPRRLRN